MKIAIMGAGSMGTIVGAFIAKKGGDVVLIDANKEHVAALNSNGAQIVGKLDMIVPVKAITPDQMAGTYDVVFYMVKQTANSIALKQLLPHLAERSTVCTLQNGVPEDAVAEIVGAERTIGGTVGWGATWVKPGVSMFTSNPDKMTYEVGALDGRITVRLQAVAAVLSMAGKPEMVTNLQGARWSKLLLNATGSGMSTVLGGTFGDVLDNPKALLCAAHVGDETVRVAKARGIKMEPMQGNDISAMTFKNKQELQEVFSKYHAALGPHRLLKASMLQDLEKGLRCEIDAINGTVSSWGKVVGVPTPVNDKVVELIKSFETGKNKPAFGNLEKFTLPEVPE